MLEAFKLKPFDLEPIYTSWTDGPRFVGNPTKDGPVDDWLSSIKAGCIERKVSQEYWHKVGQHFMGEQAKARLDELKLVMGKVHGGKYRWNWKRFKIAMRNMGCQFILTLHIRFFVLNHLHREYRRHGNGAHQSPG
jgi:hypothetical protein